MEKKLLIGLFFLAFSYLRTESSAQDLYLNPLANQERGLETTEMSREKLIDFYLLQAGVADAQERSAHLHRLFHPNDADVLAWATKTSKTEDANLIDQMLSAYLLAETAEGKALHRKIEPRLDTPLSQLDGNLSLYMNADLPLTRISPETLAEFGGGLTEPLPLKKQETLKGIVREIFVNDRETSYVQRGEHGWLFWIYINQTGDKEILKAMWDSGQTEKQNHVLMTLAHVEGDSNLLVLGVNHVKQVVSGVAKTPSFALYFLDYQRGKRIVRQYIRDLVNSYSGDLYLNLPTLVRMLRPVEGVKEADSKADMEVLMTQMERTQRLWDALEETMQSYQPSGGPKQ